MTTIVVASQTLCRWRLWAMRDASHQLGSRFQWLATCAAFGAAVAIAFASTPNRSRATAADLNVAKTNIGSAEAQVAAAKAQLRFAQLQLQYTKVYAPESGNVTQRNVESGAFISAGQPLLAVVRTERWVVGNFKEVQLRRMRIGQPVEVRVDSFPDTPLRGRVQSLQSGTGSRFELLPPENATGNWVKVVQRLPVKIVFEPDQPGVERLEPGMSAEVRVDTGKTSAPASTEAK